jgi:hypothetical protein
MRSLRRDRELATDDQGSMAILLLVVLLGLMLGAVLVPMVVTTSRASAFDKTRVQALDAAQAGIDVTLGGIRAGVTAGVGDSTRLPCGPGSGTVNTASVARYDVAVEYFVTDPRSETFPSARAMQCIAGYGTYDTATGTTTPAFARITSTGSVGTPTNGSSPSRTLTTTYVFRTSNVNILGGLLMLEGAPSLCADAGGATPTEGSVPVLRACTSATPAAPQQVFAYRSDLTLQLVSSITNAYPNGLCLTPARTPAVAGDPVKLLQCGPLGTPATYTQQWSYNDNANYQAAQADSATTGNLPNLCLNAVSQSAGQSLVVGGCGNVWRPTAAVGPGAAALPQWVNFAEFGRCLDVTYQDVNYPFLISYPCKQNPFPAAKLWNQLFTAPSLAGVVSATGQIYTTPVVNGTKYCLTSPGTAGGYATVRPCIAGSAQQTWTLYGGDASLNYSTKYTIVNGAMCLGLGSVNAAAGFSSTVVVKNCTGATDQKWNAVANTLNPALRDTWEK